MKNKQMTRILMTSLGLLLLVASAPPSLKAQGFGGTLGMGAPKTVGIKRRLPAAVNLNQKRINVEATSAVPDQKELVAVLTTKLTTMIQR